jgi:hypothetical protein|tara:strand:+ start:6202 stop:6552 length:351 start_codon:yes stop_codon:yes gene_type:complete
LIDRRNRFASQPSTRAAGRKRNSARFAPATRRPRRGPLSRAPRSPLAAAGDAVRFPASRGVRRSNRAAAPRQGRRDADRELEGGRAIRADGFRGRRRVADAARALALRAELQATAT